MIRKMKWYWYGTKITLYRAITKFEYWLIVSRQLDQLFVENVRQDYIFWSYDLEFDVTKMKPYDIQVKVIIINLSSKTQYESDKFSSIWK